MVLAIQTLVMPWDFAQEVDVRFRRILRYNLIAFLILGLIMPWLPLPTPEKNTAEVLPPRMAKLLQEPKPVTPPKREPVVLKTRPEAKPKSTPKPIPKPQKKPPPPARQQQARQEKRAPVEKTVSARQQAEQSGLLALQDTLSDLRDNSITSSLRKTRELSQAGGQAQRTERTILTSGTTSGSDGIQTASLSRNATGTTLASRTTTRIQGPAGTSATTASSRGKDRAGRTAGRSIEKIQMIFDRNKGAIYSIYNRALRQNPSLQGKVVLQLTISPSGKVTRCTIVSSELGDLALGEKIAQRVGLFNFGAEDVNEVTITYPIDFLPA